MRNYCFILLILIFSVNFIACGDSQTGEAVIPAWANSAFHLNIKDVMKNELFKSMLPKELEVSLPEKLQKAGIKSLEDITDISGGFFVSATEQKGVVYVELNYDMGKMESYLDSEEVKAEKGKSVNGASTYIFKQDDVNISLALLKNMIIFTLPDALIEECISLALGKADALPSASLLNKSVNVINNNNVFWLAGDITKLLIENKALIEDYILKFNQLQGILALSFGMMDSSKLDDSSKAIFQLMANAQTIVSNVFEIQTFMLGITRKDNSGGKIVIGFSVSDKIQPDTMKAAFDNIWKDGQGFITKALPAIPPELLAKAVEITSQDKVITISILLTEADLNSILDMIKKGDGLMDFDSLMQNLMPSVPPMDEGNDEITSEDVSVEEDVPADESILLEEEMEEGTVQLEEKTQ